MKPRQLEIFLEAADRLSIRETARQLGLSQPAVTKIVRDLEDELGVPLVERSVKGIRLTRYGQAFLPRARLLLADIRRTHEELAQMRDGSGGGVSIGISASAAAGILAPAFRAFRIAAPVATAKISEGLLRQLIAGLRDGTHDFVVTVMSEARADDQEFTYTELFTSRFIVCARQDHPLSHCRSLKSLLDAEWLVPPGLTTTTGYLQSAFEAFGLPMPAQLMEGLSYSLALTLIGGTNLLGLLFASQTPASLKRGGIQQIRIKEQFPTMKIYAIRRRDEPLTPVAQQFFECLCTAARGLDIP